MVADLSVFFSPSPFYTTDSKRITKPHLSKPKRHKNLIARTQIPTDVQKIIFQLLDRKFDAKLVGGCIRDLLLDVTPKDFDIVTNAKPQQVVDVFKRARLIGRRFRIVHVNTSIGIVEISTYRKVTKPSILVTNGRKDREALNRYGKINDDYRLRDFTINALYYDLREEVVLDFTNGLQDIRSQTLRTIGNPERRFKEDCHRILRAVRFQSKLEFKLAPQLAAAIKKSKPALRNLERSRLHDDLRKLLLSGFGVISFTNLSKHQVSNLIFPHSSPRDPLTIAALANTDRRINDHKPVRIEFLLAAMYWNRFRESLSNHESKPSSHEDNRQITSHVLALVSGIFTITNTMLEFINGTWFLQSRLEQYPPTKIKDTLARKRFRAAYDLLVLRASCNDVDQKLADWWTNIQTLPNEEQQKLIAELEPKKRRKRRAKKKRTRSSPTSDETLGLST